MLPGGKNEREPQAWQRTQAWDLGVFLLRQRQEGGGTWVGHRGGVWAELDLEQVAPRLKPWFPQGDTFYFQNNYNEVEVTCKETPGGQNKPSRC